MAARLGDMPTTEKALNGLSQIAEELADEPIEAEIGRAARRLFSHSSARLAAP